MATIGLLQYYFSYQMYPAIKTIRMQWPLSLSQELSVYTGSTVPPSHCFKPEIGRCNEQPAALLLAPVRCLNVLSISERNDSGLIVVYVSNLLNWPASVKRSCCIVWVCE